MMAEECNSQDSEKSFCFTVPSKPQSIPPQSPKKHLTKQTLNEEHLFQIHKKIQRHLQDEQCLKQSEVQKYFKMLQNMEYLSPREQRIAEMAENILYKIHSQMKKVEGTLSRSKSSSNKSSQNSDKTFEILRARNIPFSQLSATQKNDRTVFSNISSDIFSPQYTQFDSDLASFNEHKSFGHIDEVNQPFSVPTMTQKDDASERSSILKLRIADVQFDSDTVSIPLELLTNLNFEDSVPERNNQSKNDNSNYGGSSQNEAFSSRCLQKNQRVGNQSPLVEVISIDAENTNLDTEGCIAENTMFVPNTDEDAMEICQSFYMEANEELEVSQVEKRFLNWAENCSDIETENDYLGNVAKKKSIKKNCYNEGSESYAVKINGDNNIIDETPLLSLCSSDLPKEGNLDYLSQDVIDETPLLFSVIENSVLGMKNDYIGGSLKNNTQSTSFLDLYKSNHKKKVVRKVRKNNYAGKIREESVPNASPTQQEEVSEFGERTIETDKSIAQSDIVNTAPGNASNSQTQVLLHQNLVSENIVYINGVDQRCEEQMDVTNLIPKEQSFDKKIKLIEDVVLNKRNKYRAVWKDKPVVEKVCNKYAKKFRVNIFEDPVDALLDIDYKPNLNKFYFPMLSREEVNQKLLASAEIAKTLDEGLKKVVKEEMMLKLDEENKFGSIRYQNNKDILGSDSDSSDDEDAQENDKKWLREYMERSKKEMKKFLKELENEKKDEEKKKEINKNLEKAGDSRQNAIKSLNEGYKEFEKLVKEIDDFSWIK